MKVDRRVRLTVSRLIVELIEDQSPKTLAVRSLLDPTQSFLLPVPAPPAIDGIAMFTRLGRLHSLDWALAYGAGTLSPDCVVTFSSASLRFRSTTTAPPIQLGPDCWVADAEGVFSSAATVTAGVETARVVLTDQW